MDPGVTTELIKLGPGGIIAALLVPVVIVLWKLWQSSESARDSEGKLAAEALFEQKIINVRSEATIDRLKDRVEGVERERDRCERELDRCLNGPEKDVTA